MSDTRMTAVRTLLAHPHARLQAIDERGFFLPLPLPPPLTELVADVGGTPRLLEGRTALDLVGASEKIAVIDTWDHGLRHGAASSIVHLVDTADDGAWVLHIVDLRELCGTFVAICVPTAEVHRPDIYQPDAEPARPRFARVQKDQVAVITHVDPELVELLGWSAEELVGHRSTDFIHPDDQPLAIANWIEMLGAPGLGRRLRLRHSRRDGSWAWFELTNHNLLADQGHVLCEMVDISDEMAAHETIRAREQLLHRLAEALPVAVVQTDAAGAVVYANHQTHVLFGDQCGTVDDLLVVVDTSDRDRLGACFAAVLHGSAGSEAEVAVGSGRDVTHLSVVVRRLDDEGVTTGSVMCLTDVTDGIRLRQELQRQARTDALTGVLNRAAVLDRLGIAIDQDGAGAAAIFLDLDHFKTVNDRDGHQAGDRVLCRVADVLRASCRDQDAVGRLGGDEFLVACTDVDSPAEARELAERLAEVLLRDVDESGNVVTASVGVAWSRPRTSTVRALVAAADAAMYEAKADRAGQVVLAR